MRMRIQVTKMMRILADPDPQHWYLVTCISVCYASQCKTGKTLRITINVPVVYIARYVMVFRRARSITRGIGRGGAAVGPGNRDFFDP
jgi:hypothetical protein